MPKQPPTCKTVFPWKKPISNRIKLGWIWWNGIWHWMKKFSLRNNRHMITVSAITESITQTNRVV